MLVGDVAVIDVLESGEECGEVGAAWWLGWGVWVVGGDGVLDWAWINGGLGAKRVWGKYLRRTPF